jgi:Parvulin-like peptidyl-prolyl isomerase
MENKVLAVVNGREITEQDLLNNIVRFPRERQAYFATEEGKKQLLEQVISFELVYNFAKDSNIENDEQYKVQLENAAKEILTQYTINKILSDVSVSNEEVQKYYNDNMSQFIQQEAVSAKHILVDSEEKAAAIAGEIKSGLSFEEAAAKYSSCPSKEQGGNLGQFTRGRMVPEFEEAAFNLNIGEISEPVKTQFGYHLIKVEEKVDPFLMTVDQVAGNIGNAILQEKQNRKYFEINQELKDKYEVEYK